MYESFQDSFWENLGSYYIYFKTFLTSFFGQTLQALLGETSYRFRIELNCIFPSKSKKWLSKRETTEIKLRFAVRFRCLATTRTVRYTMVAWQRNLAAKRNFIPLVFHLGGFLFDPNTLFMLYMYSAQCTQCTRKSICTMVHSFISNI